MCKTCEIVISEMGLIRAVVKNTNYTHVMNLVCQTLGYKHSPSDWLSDNCYELLDEHAG